MALSNLSTTYTTDDIFWNMFSNNESNWNFTMTQAIAPYQEPYPFADVCFPNKYAAGFGLQIAMLMHLVVCTGLWRTSNKAIKVIRNHFDRVVQFPEDEEDEEDDDKENEKELESKNIKKTEKHEIELSLSVTSTKTNDKPKNSKRNKQNQTVINLSEIPDDDVMAVFDCKTEDLAANDDHDSLKKQKQLKTTKTKRKKRKKSKPLKNKADFDLEQYMFEEMVTKKIASDKNEEWTSSAKFIMAIKATQIVIFDKLEQYIQQSGTRVVGIDRTQMFIVMRYCFSKCTLTDFEMKVMMHWIRFLKFSRIVVILLFTRMTLRVCLILFQILWWLCTVVISNNSTYDTSQSVWDSLFLTICMSPLAIFTWFLDFVVWNEIIIEYKALGLFNVIQSLFYWDLNIAAGDINSDRNNSDDQDEEPLNPFVMKKFQFCGCNKPSAVHKWYTYSAIFIIVTTVLSFWLKSDTGNHVGKNVMIGVIACVWLLYVAFYSYIWRLVLAAPYATLETRLLAGNSYSYTLMVIWILFDVIWEFVTKYDRICDNSTLEDAMSHGFESVYTLSFLLA